MHAWIRKRLLVPLGAKGIASLLLGSKLSPDICIAGPVIVEYEELVAFVLPNASGLPHQSLMCVHFVCRLVTGIVRAHR